MSINICTFTSANKRNLLNAVCYHQTHSFNGITVNQSQEKFKRFKNTNLTMKSKILVQEAQLLLW